MCSEQLQKARLYETEALGSGLLSEKQGFHMCAPVGWINDPNGFSYFQGETHLFFQYHPYDVVWGPMHWGHVTTKDFVKWEHLPVALAPDEVYDSFGCFSGSAIEYQGKHVIAYTGTEEVELEGKKQVLQTQCIAIGDGKDYKKLACNPILTETDLPEGGSKFDFRDPKIWQEEDGIYMVVANRASDGAGQILLYRTTDLEHWDYVTVIDASRGRYGKMWECPDFFELDKKQVLVVSPQEMEAVAGRFHAGDGTLFITGAYEKNQKQFTEQDVYPVDYGLDFYAPQTMLLPDGRRVMIAWMQAWSANWFDERDGFCGMMTFPRELFVKNNRICQLPVRELENYYQNESVLSGILLEQQYVKYEALAGRCQELQMTLHSDDTYRFAIKIAADETHYTSIVYDKGEQKLYFDRSCSGVRRDVAHTRELDVISNGEEWKLRILMDRYSVEIFINDGEQVLTSVIRTPYEMDQVWMCADKAVSVDVVKHEIGIK